MKRWLEDAAVLSNIAQFAQDREVKFTVHPDMADKNQDFGFRKQRFQYSESVGRMLKSLDWPNRSVSLFVGTNRVNWKLMRLPPPLRQRGVSGFNKQGLREYSQFWKQALLRSGCEEMHINFETLWRGQDLVWDVDVEQHIGAAFGIADEIAQFLEQKHGMHPQIVFSGSKGFHVWLHWSEAEQLVEKLSPHWKKTYATRNDPIKYRSKLYRSLVEYIGENESGAEFQINYLDLAPIQRSGIIRCPYSIHPKTGQIVWPLSASERDTLRELVTANFEVSLWEVVSTIHPWTTENQTESARESYPLMAIHPFNQVFQRGFPAWQGETLSSLNTE